MAVDPKTKLTVEQEAFLHKIISYFKGKGWTSPMAYGMAANMYAETSFRPDLWGDKGKSYGLCQWQRPRRQTFYSLYGVPMHEAPVERQFDFVIHELFEKGGGEGAAGALLRRAVNAYDAAAIISKHYERPAKDERYSRGTFAQNLFDKYERNGGQQTPIA